MNVVIPLAGKGSRFLNESDRNQEYKKPKPLIKIKGRIMIEWALSSFNLSENDQLIFILRQDHIDNFKIDDELKKVFGDNIKILIQNTPPIGMATTCLLAKEYINNDEPLLITDADNYMHGQRLMEEIEKNRKNIDGIIPVFYGNNTKWSYSKLNEEGYVEETAEKLQISRNAHIGSYYFSKGKNFVWATEEMIEEGDKTNGEYYVAPVYNYLIRRGKRIVLIRPRFAHGLGTPKDVEKFIWLLENEEVEHTFNNLSGKILIGEKDN